MTKASSSIDVGVTVEDFEYLVESCVKFDGYLTESVTSFDTLTGKSTGYSRQRTPETFKFEALRGCCSRAKQEFLHHHLTALQAKTRPNADNKLDKCIIICGDSYDKIEQLVLSLPEHEQTLCSVLSFDSLRKALKKPASISSKLHARHKHAISDGIQCKEVFLFDPVSPDSSESELLERSLPGGLQCKVLVGEAFDGISWDRAVMQGASEDEQLERLSGLLASSKLTRLASEQAAAGVTQGMLSYPKRVIDEDVTWAMNTMRDSNYQTVTELLCHLAKDLEDAIPDQVRVWSPDFKLMRVGHRLTSLAAFFSGKRTATGQLLPGAECIKDLPQLPSVIATHIQRIASLKSFLDWVRQVYSRHSNAEVEKARRLIAWSKQHGGPSALPPTPKKKYNRHGEAEAPSAGTAAHASPSSANASKGQVRKRSAVAGDEVSLFNFVRHLRNRYNRNSGLVQPSVVQMMQDYYGLDWHVGKSTAESSAAGNLVHKQGAVDRFIAWVQATGKKFPKQSKRLPMTDEQREENNMYDCLLRLAKEVDTMQPEQAARIDAVAGTAWRQRRNTRLETALDKAEEVVSIMETAVQDGKPAKGSKFNFKTHLPSRLNTWLVTYRQALHGGPTGKCVYPGVNAVLDEGLGPDWRDPKGSLGRQQTGAVSAHAGGVETVPGLDESCKGAELSAHARMAALRMSADANVTKAKEFIAWRQAHDGRKPVRSATDGQRPDDNELRWQRWLTGRVKDFRALEECSQLSLPADSQVAISGSEASDLLADGRYTQTPTWMQLLDDYNIDWRKSQKTAESISNHQQRIVEHIAWSKAQLQKLPDQSDPPPLPGRNGSDIHERQLAQWRFGIIRTLNKTSTNRDPELTACLQEVKSQLDGFYGSEQAWLGGRTYTAGQLQQQQQEQQTRGSQVGSNKGAKRRASSTKPSVSLQQGCEPAADTDDMDFSDAESLSDAEMLSDRAKRIKTLKYKGCVLYG